MRLNRTAGLAPSELGLFLSTKGSHPQRHGSDPSPDAGTLLFGGGRGVACSPHQLGQNSLLSSVLKVGKPNAIAASSELGSSSTAHMTWGGPGLLCAIASFSGQ